MCALDRSTIEARSASGAARGPFVVDLPLLLVDGALEVYEEFGERNVEGVCAAGEGGFAVCEALSDVGEINHQSSPWR